MVFIDNEMFKIPDDSGTISSKDQRIVVVSFFGKSAFLSRGCKAGVIDEVLGRRVFKPSIVADTPVDSESLCDIKAYHDAKRRVIYLHLQGSFDVQTLVKTYSSLEKELEEEGYLSVWAQLKYSYARALLYLFCVSHVLVCVHPTHAFDMSYMNLFRALDSVRLKCQTMLGESLVNLQNVSKEWSQVGRMCTPRLLFLFESCPAPFRNVFIKEKSSSSSLCQSLKKFEHSLEDQIYFVLRKNRIITKNSCTSLFAIPANQEFVFVQTSSDSLKDWKSTFMGSLVDLCVGPNAGCAVSKDNYCPNLQPPTEGNGSLDHTFKKFLQQHLEQAHLKGFDDNVSRHAAPVHFEVPTLGVWLEVATEMFKYLVSADKWNSTSGPLSSLRVLLNTDVKFSEGRCGKVLPLALATYQEKLPAHYTREYHKGRLAHALSVFAVHARGPLFEKYARQLEADCEAHWRDGRQMCQVLSLTGNPCTNPLHNGGGEGAGGGELAQETGDTSQLPVMEHCSGVRYISACNCGRKQGPRDDPFSVRAANCDFYTLLGKECGCCHLENVQFPVFVPSTKDFRAAKLFSGNKKESSCSPNEMTNTGSNTQGFSLAEAMLRLPSAFVSGQSGGSDVTEEAGHLNRNGSGPETGDAIVIHVGDSNQDTRDDKGLVRQPSTTEYLPGMLHTESPSGLLPQFQSWSLVCLGPSSLYSHNLGLQEQQQAGLLPGSAFLLPWDLTVRLEHQRERPNVWPTVGDSAYGRGKTASSALQRPRKTKRDGAEFVVKIFIGVEYECPRGHRFMCSAPDKVLKTIGSGIVKDTGNKVTGSDMPLYFPCPCKTTKPLIAQLMRIHVVTPKAPVHVTLSPKVQPAPAPCPVFVPGIPGLPGNEETVKLSQSAYWVLRLPYVYVGDHGPYIAPKEPVPLNYGRLLAGMYGITEVVPHEK